MGVSKSLNRKVRKIANDRCEYCKMHQSLQGATFHVEHVIPVSRDGKSVLANLVLACPSCNLHKSNRIKAVDPQTQEVVALFHPRHDDWGQHFGFLDFTIVGKTKCARATIDLLNLNHPRKLKVREAEALFDLFPP
jgi:HNH endonuclease